MAISKITFLSSLFPFLMILLLSCSNPLLAATSGPNTNVYNVISFGAKPDGVTDSKKAFLGAWDAACASESMSVISVPKGRYLVGAMVFRGECKSPKIGFEIDGTIVGPSDYRVLGGEEKWISFVGVTGVSIVGGKMDARGAALWSCKLASNGGDHCPDGATSLSFSNSKNIKIIGLLSLNSQMFHITINGCQNVRMQGVKVIAAGNSPNTDGIHVQRSTDVVIKDSSIRTGDDCISVGPRTENLWIEHIACGPGHGISIGSLGREADEQGVQNVTVKSVVFSATQNGVRIKTWANSNNGFVKGVQFLDITMNNVQNPIVIDQNYCPHNINCPNQASGVKISNVAYTGIRGTSATPIAVKFDCSVTNPCTGIELKDVNLTYLDQEAQSECSNVDGKAFGLIQPNSCL